MYIDYRRTTVGLKRGGETRVGEEKLLPRKEHGGKYKHTPGL